MADLMQFPVDSTDNNCHTDKKKSSDKSVDSCCQDMSLCNSSVSFVSNSLLSMVQISNQSVQLTTNEHAIFNTASPPSRPPKLIN